MKDQWDKRYTAEEYIYGIEPNDFFREEISNISPGMILLPGEGEGRNAVYSAKKGWDVSAFDYSSEAKRKALKLAEKNAVHINFEIEELSKYAFREASFDVIGIFFFHLPEGLRRYLHFQSKKALKPGGTLIIEAFHKDQIEKNSGGPKNPEWLYTKKKLKEDLTGLELVKLDRKIRKLNEGPIHQGDAEVIQVVAKKPLQ